MRVLFVSSGNTGDVGVLVKNQANSLVKAGVSVDFFLIKGKGILGYLKSVRHIRRTFHNGKYDLIHAHYSLSAFAASLAGRYPLVVSLMGSDAYLSGILRLIARFFYYTSWDATIVKTQRMKTLLKMKRAIVLPNGVDTEIFKEIPKEVARKEIGYYKLNKLIIFVADPTRAEKNFELAKKAFDLCQFDDAELMPVYNVPNHIIPYYLNAADVLLLTSKWEGSVNVVKEAMACNLPIVSTDVGDVKDNLSEVNGCYIATHDPIAIKNKLLMALSFIGKTNGAEKLKNMGIDSESVANRLIFLYQSVVKYER